MKGVRAIVYPDTRAGITRSAGKEMAFHKCKTARATAPCKAHFYS